MTPGVSSRGGARPTSAGACPDCLRRSWLLGRLSGHLDRMPDPVDGALGLSDSDLIDGVGGRQADLVRRELDAFDPAQQRRSCAETGVTAVCRCMPGYPHRLRDLSAPPAVLHIVGQAGVLNDLGGMVATRVSIAIVGARRGGPYALGVARDLSRGVAAAGCVVVSGMALGVDSAAHEGALAASGTTIAVLPCAPQRPYPRSRRALHRRIVDTGLVVSELGPGTAARRWMFPARNRIIAALSDLTVIVAAGAQSGAMVTARVAEDLGRHVGAVPGPVTSALSVGPHELLRRGAGLIGGTGDALHTLLGEAAAPPGRQPPAGLDDELGALLAAIGDGRDLSDAFSASGLDVREGMAALAALELVGYVRREAGGRYTAALR